MTIDELSRAISTVLPEHAFGVDNYGQIIIYTNTMLDGTNVVPFVESE